MNTCSRARRGSQRQGTSHLVRSQVYLQNYTPWGAYNPKTSLQEEPAVQPRATLGKLEQQWGPGWERKGDAPSLRNDRYSCNCTLSAVVQLGPQLHCNPKWSIWLRASEDTAVQGCATTVVIGLCLISRSDNVVTTSLGLHTCSPSQCPF